LIAHRSEARTIEVDVSTAVSVNLCHVSFQLFLLARGIYVDRFSISSCEVDHRIALLTGVFLILSRFMRSASSSFEILPPPSWKFPEAFQYQGSNAQTGLG
jgi:hypothetical protein